MILDLSAGFRWMWDDRKRDDVVFLDIRRQTSPTVLADSRRLPFKDGTFELILFDPPHVNFGARSNMSRDFGHLTTAQIRDLLKGTFAESRRVAAKGAKMVFKWNDHDQRLERVLEIARPWWLLMFGSCHRRNSRGATLWCMMEQAPEGGDGD